MWFARPDFIARGWCMGLPPQEGPNNNDCPLKPDLVGFNFGQAIQEGYEDKHILSVWLLGSSALLA